MYKYCAIALLSLLLLGACNTPEPKENQILNQNILIECNEAIRNAIVVDRITPPLASRRYYYANVASYEAMVLFHPEYLSMAGQLNGLNAILHKTENGKAYAEDVVMLAAHTFASNALVYQKDSIESFRNRKISFYKAKLHKAVLERSLSLGDSIGAAIIKWSKADNFNATRAMRLFEVTGKSGDWEPTHPDFMEAIEPNWGKIRFAAVKPGTIQMKGPEPYSESKSSRFFANCMEVYHAVDKNKDSLVAIAKYWDDAPVSVEHVGHTMIKSLKVSPGGHWVNIFGNMAKQNKLNLMSQAEGFMRMSAAIFDAFILCWEAKYRYDYIRPITAIRRLADSTYSPAIQTPAFPEYPSGHSTISGAASATLTHLFGSKAFVDSTEFEFGLGVRSFKSFYEAADQASFSRLYGGIHFKDALVDGVIFGKEIAKQHIEKIKSKK